MMERGAFRVSRAVFDHPVLAGEPFDRRSAWLWLISEAAWEKRTVNRAGKVIHLARGELAHSLRYMRDVWGWEHKRVDRFLKKLAELDMIRITAEAGITVTSICRYDTYQSVFGPGQDRDRAGTTNGAATGTGDGTGDDHGNADTTEVFAIVRPDDGTGNGTATGTPVGEGVSENRDKANKQINKRKNIRSSTAALGKDNWPPDAFKLWYAAYLKKKSPKDAERAFEKVRKAGEITFDQLMAATKRDADRVVRERIDPRFIPYPASWLNGGSYLDEEDSSPPEAVDGTIAKPQRDPKSFTKDDWAPRVAHYRDTGGWSGHWGPAPGSSECLVPSDLIIGVAV
jgi:hypothetical protein